jgi:hypothetical protein
VLTSYTTGQLILDAKLQHLTKYSQRENEYDDRFPLTFVLFQSDCFSSGSFL